jgi:hypothetical protein
MATKYLVILFLSYLPEHLAIDSLTPSAMPFLVPIYSYLLACIGTCTNSQKMAKTGFRTSLGASFGHSVKKFLAK